MNNIDDKFASIMTAITIGVCALIVFGFVLALAWRGIRAVLGW